MMTSRNAAHMEPDSWLPNLNWPAIAPIVDASTTVVGRLLELGCTNLSKSMERYWSNLQSLADVRDVAAFIDLQQQFVRGLWDDQEQAFKAAAGVIREGFEAARVTDIAPVAKAQPASPATARVAAPAPARSESPKIAAVPQTQSIASGRSVAQAKPAPSKFELYLDRSGAYRFRLKASDGSVLLSSEAYKSRSSATNGIASVKKNAPVDARYQKQVSDSGKPSFNLKAGNHQVIGTSRAFTSADRMESAIKLIQQTAATADVDDQTQAA